MIQWLKWNLVHKEKNVGLRLTKHKINEATGHAAQYAVLFLVSINKKQAQQIDQTKYLEISKPAL